MEFLSYYLHFGSGHSWREIFDMMFCCHFWAHCPCMGNCMLYVIITLQRAFSFGLLRLLNQWLRLWLGLWFWLGSQLGQVERLPFRLEPQIGPYVNCDVTQIPYLGILPIFGTNIFPRF